jgi:hypothetical protein
VQLGELALMRSSSSPQQQQWQQSWLHQQLFDEGSTAAAAAEGDAQQVPPLLQPDSAAEQPQQQPSIAVSHADITQAVWACGRLRHYNAALFATLRPRFRGLLPGFTDSQLVEVLWGLAHLQLYDAPNMDAAADEVRRLPLLLTASDLMLKPARHERAGFFACCSASHTCRVRRALVLGTCLVPPQLLSRAHRLSGPLVALCAWVYARLRHRHPTLMAGLARRAVQLAAQQQLRPLDARQLVYAAARLAYRDPALLKACAQVRVAAAVVLVWDRAAAQGSLGRSRVVCCRLLHALSAGAQGPAVQPGCERGRDGTVGLCNGWPL